MNLEKIKHPRKAPSGPLGSHVKRQSLAAVSVQGPLLRPALRKQPALSHPPTRFLPPEPLERSLWDPVSANRTRAFPIQSELHSSNQLEPILTNQGSAFGPIELRI